MYHRVGPPPVVRLSLAGLGNARLPAMIGQQRLWVVGAEAPRDAAPSEGSQQRPHHRGGQQFPVHEVHPEAAAFRRQRAYDLKKSANGSWRQVEEQPLYQPNGRLLHLIAGIEQSLRPGLLQVHPDRVPLAGGLDSRVILDGVLSGSTSGRSSS